ncbi:MAG: hypothetical protein GOU98_02300 [Candidatus Altiarchaeota archaeon]|nr:hypothetical protein [Candidatus Altiarchaeota archaeon]
MRYTGLLLAGLLVFSLVAPVAAQGLDADQVANSLSPLKALVEGVTRIGWDLTQLFVGMDDASIAVFSYELGFRKGQVYVNVTAADAVAGLGTYQDCIVSSFILDETSDSLECKKVSDSSRLYVTLGETTTAVTGTLIGDYNQDGNEKQLDDAFGYIVDSGFGSVVVENSAKGQIMLFALIIPLGMLFFLLNDFFISTGLLRKATAGVLSLGVALISARSGVYTALLGMISDIFGAGGFFLSMLSIYLILAVLMWFYGGVLKSKAIAEKDEEVADAVVDAFTADLRRGVTMKETAKALAKNDKK